MPDVFYPDPYNYGLTNPDYYPFSIYSGEPSAASIPTLQELAAGADTDQEVIYNVVHYYERHQDVISEGLGEKNPERLKALYIMYLVHMAHPYGLEAKAPQTLTEYIHGIDFVDCDKIAHHQAILTSGFGLPWRWMGLRPLHSWLEVEIDGNWEIFDATANTWVNHGAYELMEGQPRTYRNFYTPWMDEERGDARHYAQELVEGKQFSYFPGTNDTIVMNQAGPAVLRAYMPGLGIYYPPVKYCEHNESLCIPYVIERSGGSATPAVISKDNPAPALL